MNNKKLSGWGILVKPTHKCNFACKYCYDKPTRDMYGDGLMSIETLSKIVDLSTDYAKKIDWIWHGGEPLTVPMEWYRQAQELFYKKFTNEIPQSMQSNGYLLTKEWARFIYNYNIHLGISYDSYGQAVRTQADNDKVYDNIKLALSEGIQVGIINVINATNYKNQIDMYKLYRDELGVNPSFNHIYRSDGSLKNNLEMNPEDYSEEYKKFLIYYLNDSSEKVVCERTADTYVSLVQTGKGSTCNTSDCRKNWISVNSAGVIYPCDRHVPEMYNLGNIADYSSIDEVYSSANFKKYYNDIRRRFVTHCTPENCGYLGLCNGLCNANHIAVTGDGSGVDTVSCDIFKLCYAKTYDVLRDIAFTDGAKRYNKNIVRSYKATTSFTWREIKEFLLTKGIGYEFEYNSDPGKLLKCQEHRVYRLFNPTLEEVQTGEATRVGALSGISFNDEYNLASCTPSRLEVLEARFNQVYEKLFKIIYEVR